MSNPYLERMRRSNIGQTGRASEKKLAKKIGGRLTPASGAVEGAKGDISLNRVLMEAKSTVNDSLSVKFDWLAKISHEALFQGKSPALSVSFVDKRGQAYPNGEWVMIPLKLWQEKFNE